jgi:1-acyl-sn-glycerol-3-phosphate acyltransferase
LAHVLVGAAAAYAFLDGSRGSSPRSIKQRALVRWWMGRLCRVLGMDVKIHGAPSTDGTLLVANHVSWLDIPAFMSALDVNFVSKHEVLQWPFVGSMATRAGTLYIVRGGREAAATTAEQMARRLTQPYSIAIFPEGTTTDGRELRRFHARLYQAAVEARAPIQAVAIK